MSCDEVEVVIVYEISYIVNGDMVIMILIQGVVNIFVIFIFCVIVQIVVGFFGGNWEDEGESSNGNLLIYFVVVMVFELVFGILVSIIIMWFLCYCEFYVDVGLVCLVGCEKMIVVLQCLKISYELQEVSSMMVFCINGKVKFMSELFMIYLLLDKCIEVLCSGEYLK